MREIIEEIYPQLEKFNALIGRLQEAVDKQLLNIEQETNANKMREDELARFKQELVEEKQLLDKEKVVDQERKKRLDAREEMLNEKAKRIAQIFNE